MELKLEIANEHEYKVPENFEKVILKTFEILSFNKNTLISLAFLNESEISKIYEEYFGYAHITDVLSFSSEIIDPESGFLYLGEILICYPFVVKQAQSVENELDSEVSLLIVHGLLHLLGYDHDNESNKNKMWNMQSAILNSLDLKINKIPE